MAGSCDAFVREAGHSCVLYVPYKYWGLQIGRTYRVVLKIPGTISEQLPYSYDTKPYKVGASARISIPKSITHIKKGDLVNIWVGEPQEYNKGGHPVGRGNSQAERAKYLEEQIDLLH